MKCLSNNNNGRESVLKVHAFSSILVLDRSIPPSFVLGIDVKIGVWGGREEETCFLSEFYESERLLKETAVAVKKNIITYI